LRCFSLLLISSFGRSLLTFAETAALIHMHYQINSTILTTGPRYGAGLSN
jgi:hypothetical protein